MAKNNKKTSWGLLIIILITIICIVIFRNDISNQVSQDFIKNYLIIISISIFGLGFIALQKDIKNELKNNLLNASIFMAISIISGLFYMVHERSLLIGITFGMISMWAFIFGFIYFFLILIKEKMNSE